jgi:hypothetical protein
LPAPDSKTERLEFMYKGPMMEGPALPPAPAAAVEPAVPLPAALMASATASATANAVSVYVDDTPKARNEAWARLHGDPMLMVRSRTAAQFCCSRGVWRSTPALRLC